MIRLKNLIGVNLLYAFLTLFAAPGFADDIDQLVRQCEACHGPDGNSVLPLFPSISGFTYDGFFFAIDRYRENRRTAVGFQQPGQPDTMMKNIAQQLSDEQVGLLAAYYAGRPYVPVRQAFDPKMADRGAILHERYCEKCHEQNGTAAIDNAAIIAGQWTPYLKTQIENIISGKRIIPRRMANLFKKLSQDDIDALLNFYASFDCPQDQRKYAADDQPLACASTGKFAGN